jgi:purine-binding chemotaxis protein CheW
MPEYVKGVVNVGTEMGVVVDTVQEVFDINENQIEPPSAVGDQVDTEFILGMGKLGKRVKILLDIDCVMSMQEKAALEELADG